MTGPTILLRSSWQTVNIGDIAHTPGLLAVLAEHLPEANLILWPGPLDRGVDRMLDRHYPYVHVLDPSQPEPVRDAIAQADLMIHGSGPGLPGIAALRTWQQQTDKPFGLFGVTLEQISDDHRPLVEKASFIFTRETLSLKVLEKAGIADKPMAFTPDATLAMTIRDESAADRLMAEHDFEPGRFLCIVPRLRRTPYHQIYNEARFQAVADEVTRLNQRHAETDHRKLRAVIERFVRDGGGRVLLCPEMTYQLDLMDELLLNPLPADVRPHVSAMRHYWLPDAAASLYARAAAVVSFECHSPLLSVAAGGLAFHIRQPEDTIKGEMYRDFGMGSCVFEVDPVDGNTLADAVLSRLSDGTAARKAQQARDTAHRLHANACGVIGDLLSSASNSNRHGKSQE